jgi:hypothetical protein
VAAIRRCTTTSIGVAVSEQRGHDAADHFSVAASEVQTTAATIGWTTNEPADSQVEYGLTTGYGSSTTLSTGKITSHAVPVNNLTPGTLYNFRVKSRDAAGNLATSANSTFTTTAVADTTPPNVTLTAPADGASVSGAVQVSASASDNIGVAGVQFKQGATNIGAEDTTSPCAVSPEHQVARRHKYADRSRARPGGQHEDLPVTVTVTAGSRRRATYAQRRLRGNGERRVRKQQYSDHQQSILGGWQDRFGGGVQRLQHRRLDRRHQWLTG